MKQGFRLRGLSAPSVGDYFALHGCTNVNGANALPFIHNEPLALREAWNKFETCVGLCGSSAWFLRVEYPCGSIERAAELTKVLPSVMHRLNNSRRMRRIGVSGARLANVFHRGSSFFYVSDSVFRDWYACLCVAFPLVWRLLPNGCGHKLIIGLRRSGRSRSSASSTAAAFMRAFRERAHWARSRWSLDPLDSWEVSMSTNETGLTMGVFSLLLDSLGDYVEYIQIGRYITISRKNEADDDDYAETLQRPYKNFRFKYLTLFGEFSKLF